VKSKETKKSERKGATLLPRSYRQEEEICPNRKGRHTKGKYEPVGGKEMLIKIPSRKVKDVAGEKKRHLHPL